MARKRAPLLPPLQEEDPHSQEGRRGGADFRRGRHWAVHKSINSITNSKLATNSALVASCSSPVASQACSLPRAWWQSISRPTSCSPASTRSQTLYMSASPTSRSIISDLEDESHLASLCAAPPDCGEPTAVARLSNQPYTDLLSVRSGQQRHTYNSAQQ